MLLAPLFVVLGISGCARHEQMQSAIGGLRTQEDCNLGAGETCNQQKPQLDIYLKVIDGDIDAVKSELDSGFDVNAQQSATGKTILMFAIEMKQVAFVEYLVNYPDIDLEIEDLEGRKALWYAEQTQDDILISLITGETVTVEELNASMMSAIRDNKLEVVKSLLEDGAEIEARVRQDGNIVTPLLFAIQLGYLDIVEHLLLLGASTHSTLWSEDRVDSGVNGLMMAIDRANLELFNLILPKTTDVEAKDGDGKTAMFYTAHIKTDLITAQKIADRLINRGASLVSAKNDGRHFLTYVYEDQSNIPLGDYLYDICLVRHSQVECDEI